mgnify:CR=1 FL=1
MTLPNWRMRFVNGAARTQNTRAEQEEAEFLEFIATIVRPAFSSIAQQLVEKGKTVTPHETRAACGITVSNGMIEEITFRILRQTLPNSIVPTIEVKMHERRGLRIQSKTVPLSIGSEKMASLRETKSDEIVAAFFKFYTEALRNLN